MNSIKKAIKIVALISGLLSLAVFFWPNSYPTPDELLPATKSVPHQAEIKENLLLPNLQIDKYIYEISPLYKYEIAGLVVSEYSSENYFDITHKEDPGNIKDLCLVWGENAKNGSYLDMKFKSGEFTCYAYPETSGAKFNPSQFSNNHLLPANEAVAEKIRRISVGDEVKISGYLVSYKAKDNGKELYTRGTSISREDIGNGACEVIYVEEIEIVNDNYKAIDIGKKNLPKIFLTSIVTWLGVFLIF